MPPGAGKAVLTAEATKQDLIRSARANGNFQDAESAINRSGKSLDWDQRNFGFELKGTEGDSTHGLIIMLKGDTEEELDDAVVSVYFKKRALAGYEVKSVLVTQILERSGNRVEGAIADLVTGTGTWVAGDLDSQKPEESSTGTIAGRRTLEQLATIEPFVPPVDTLGGRHHALPPDFPRPDDCNNSNELQKRFNEMQDKHKEYADVWKNLWTNVGLQAASGFSTIAGYSLVVAGCFSTAYLCAAGLAAGVPGGLAWGYVNSTLDDFWVDIAYKREEWRGAFQRYLNQWAREGCGPFPFGEFEDLL